MVFLLGLVLSSPFVVALATALLVVLGVASYWRVHALDEVFYRRRFPYRRGFPGERFPVKIEIENRKFLPLTWLRVQDAWPKAVGPEDEQALAPSHIEEQGLLTHLVSLRWFERARREYSLLFRKRGVYRIGPVAMQSGDIFGMYQQEKSLDPPDVLTVFPPLLPLSTLDLPAEDPLGERRSTRRLFEDPNQPMGVRPFHPEDSFRQVHWPATARTAELQVKVYQPVSAKVMTLCLNVATFARHWEGFSPALLERLVSTAATLVNRSFQDGYQVGLISNGCLANSDQPFRIPPGRSPQQLSHLLRALAGVTPLVTAPFERFLLKEVPGVPYGAILVILTAVTTPELAEMLLRLKRHERRLVLLSLSMQAPPALPGVRVLHRPFNPG